MTFAEVYVYVVGERCTRYKYVSAAVHLQKFMLWVKDVPGYKYMSTVNLKLKVAISR